MFGIGSLLVGMIGVMIAEEIPLQGRPTRDFYFAIGNRVEIRATVMPSECRVDEEMILTLRCQCIVNLAEFRRPDLREVPTFHNLFLIYDLPDPQAEPGERAFAYRLRPRTEAITEIPEFAFRYYSPDRRQSSNDATKWFPAAYTDPIPVRILPALKPVLAPVPLDVPAYAETLPDDPRRVLEHAPASWPRWGWLLLLLPPLLVFWRHRTISGQGDISHHRLDRKTLARLRGADADVRAIMCEYVQQRWGADPHAQTPTEIEQSLQHPQAPKQSIRRFFEQCDAVRYGGANFALAPLALALLKEWESIA